MLVPDQEEASAAGLKQKALALQGVQKRINQNDTSDAVVGAIAALASVEVFPSSLWATGRLMPLICTSRQQTAIIRPDQCTLMAYSCCVKPEVVIPSLKAIYTLLEL